MSTTLTREHIIAKLCQLAAEQAAVNADEVTLDTHLQNDLNFDSLDMVEFTMKLEEAFDISVPDESAEHVRTIGDAVTMLGSIFLPDEHAVSEPRL